MDNNGLNINRPLLSVRRFSLKSSSQKNENRRNESYLPVKPSTDQSCKTVSTSTSIPFGWEHSPGKPKKNEKNKQIQIMENPPKLTPVRFFRPRKIFKAECSKSTKKESSASQNNADGETYMDALDTLSPGETSFNRSDVKIRDFMLGRFLPAARAMASDVPQHTSKKMVFKEKPQEVKKLVKMDDNRNKVNVTHGKEEDDDYGSDYEYHEHGTKSSKFCGLIPRFRAANPVHGACKRGAKLPISPVNRTHASSSGSSFRETDSEPARSAVYKHRSLNSVLKIKSNEPANLEGSKLYSRLQGPAISVDFSGSIQSTVSKQSSSSSKKKGILTGPAISVDVSGSIQSTVSEQSDSSSKKKGISFRELISDKKNTNEITETDSQDSIFEKTLYVDTVQIAESPKETSASSSKKPQSSFNESLELDILADESKHDMKTRKCKDPDAEFELLGDAKGNQKLKGYEPKLFQHLAPPPLPKSPSDSWLCRTLPSVSSKKAHTLWIPIYPSSNTIANDPKTDEKDQLQSPQEPMNPIPES